MGLIQIPRVAAAVLRGHLNQRKLPRGSTAAVGIDRPHVSLRRAGIWDVDVLGHMNNAAYMVHCEMARWEMAAYGGLLGFMAKNRLAFIVGGATLRFRKEVRPFTPFEVHTHVSAADERWLYFSQTLQPRGGGKAFAQSLCRAVILKAGKSVAPRAMLEDAGIDSTLIDLIPAEMQQEHVAFAELDEAFKAAPGLTGRE